MRGTLLLKLYVLLLVYRVEKEGKDEGRFFSLQTKKVIFTYAYFKTSI